MLNIKNPETHKLAAELARLTGASMTEAVTEALREKLAALQAETSKEARYQKLMRMASEFAARLPPDADLDIDKLLYDPETGLPK
ncbi:MAG: type II toxin-antitoxin system VapB family antitoxin [Terricaulis sp.]